MTRTLTITSAEWEAVRDGHLWIVRHGGCHNPCTLDMRETFDICSECSDAPADLLAAVAPCETCVNTRRWWDQNATPTGANAPCPDCRITLLGECDCCGGPAPEGGLCMNLTCTDPRCPYVHFCPDECAEGRVVLGYAYPVGKVLPIIRGWTRTDGDSSGDVLSVWPGHYGRPCVMQRAWDATAIHTRYDDRTDALGRYGDPAGLVGKWALQLAFVGR